MDTITTYGLACERTRERTASLRALVLAVHAHRAMCEATADGSGWDLALTGGRAVTHAAVDACARQAAKVLPPGKIGGELLASALKGAVPGLEVKL